MLAFHPVPVHEIAAAGLLIGAVAYWAAALVSVELPRRDRQRALGYILVTAGVVLHRITMLHPGWSHPPYSFYGERIHEFWVALRMADPSADPFFWWKLVWAFLIPLVLLLGALSVRFVKFKEWRGSRWVPWSMWALKVPLIVCVVGLGICALSMQVVLSTTLMWMSLLIGQGVLGLHYRDWERRRRLVLPSVTSDRAK